MIPLKEKERIKEAWNQTEMSFECSGYTNDNPRVCSLLRRVISLMARTGTGSGGRIIKFQCKPGDEFNVKAEARGRRRPLSDAHQLLSLFRWLLSRIVPRGESVYAKVFFKHTSQDET